MMRNTDEDVPGNQDGNLNSSMNQVLELERKNHELAVALEIANRKAAFLRGHVGHEVRARRRARWPRVPL